MRLIEQFLNLSTAHLLAQSPPFFEYILLPAPAPLPSTKKAMAPHLTSKELDQLHSWEGEKTLVEIHGLLKKQRRKQKVKPLCLTAVRKALRGLTHRQGRIETRGRPREVTARGVEAMDRARKRLQEKVDGEDEVS